MRDSAAALRRAELLGGKGASAPRPSRETRPPRPAAAVRRAAASSTSRDERRPCESSPSRAAQELAALIVQEPELLEAFLDLPETPCDPQIFRVLTEALRLATTRHPNYADLHHYAARVLERAGEWDKALREDDEALRINPAYTQAWIHAGSVLSRMKRFDAAEDRYEHALRHGADYPDVHYQLGQVRRHRGNREGARRSFRRALELNERYTAAKEALATLTV